jgi:hypothetical protein
MRPLALHAVRRPLLAHPHPHLKPKTHQPTPCTYPQDGSDAVLMRTAVAIMFELRDALVALDDFEQVGWTL